jgi:hypothetical protein
MPASGPGRSAVGHPPPVLPSDVGHPPPVLPSDVGHPPPVLPSAVGHPPLLLLVLALWLAACGGGSPAPDASWPAGALLSARREALMRTLDRLAQLEGTPLAHAARDLADALPDCPELTARAPDGIAGLREALRCAGPEAELAGLRRYRGEADLALALPVAKGPRVLLTSRERDGRTDLEIRWPRSAAAATAAGLLPGAKDAGPAVLATGDRVLHARVRSDGLDLASLAPRGSQADELFRLRSQLLSKALLDGTWELAIYPPAPGEAMPRVAAALGVRAEAAARAAADRFLDDVESAWPLRRRAVVFDGREGACLPDLNLLPQLAPCLLASDGALLLGWNAGSLRHALDRANAAGATPGSVAGARDAPGRVEIDFARLGEADRSLAALHGDGATSEVTRWPWRRLVARGRRSGDAIALHVELVELVERDS